MISRLFFLMELHQEGLGRVGAYRNTFSIVVAMCWAPVGGHGFAIQQLAIETAGLGQTTPQNGWQKTIAEIHDPQNKSIADISYWVVEGNVGAVAGFTKIGAANVQARRVGSPP